MQQSQKPEASLTPLLTRKVAAHKLFPPAPLPGALPRTHVLERMLGAHASRVQVLQAPAGYGKSTLLQQAKVCCEARGEATAWLTLDEADNDVTRSLAHLQALARIAAGGAPGAVSAPSEAAGQDSHALRPDWFISALLEIDQPVAIFLDEFQALADPKVLGLFQQLLERAPDTIRLLVGSRAVPDLNLSRLTLDDSATILRPEDLCFSLAEVQQFFAESEALDLGESETLAVHERTEGWPAALQLYRLALAEPRVRLSLTEKTDMQPHQLTEYLADNVLRLQTPEIQSFLLHSAPLVRLSAELCDDVLERDDSQAMLSSLKAAGLFLRTVEPEGRWYRYHSLFASFLVEQLQQQQPVELLRVHARAVDWFQTHGLVADAMHHACQCNEFAAAAGMLEQWARELVPQGHLRTVERWYERIPAVEISRRPDLAVTIAYALIFLHRHDQLAPLLTLLEGLSEVARKRMQTHSEVVRSMAAIIAYDDLPAAAEIVGAVTIDDPEARGFRAFELAAAANLVGFLELAKGEFEDARQSLALARAHSDRVHARFSGGYTIGTAGMNLLVQGRMEEALDLLAAGVSQVSRRLDGSLSLAVAVSCYIGALYEVDRIDDAIAQFRQYRDVIVDAAALDYFAIGVLAIARIHSARGCAAQSAEILDEAEAVAHRCQWQRLLRIIGWERVRQAIVADDVGSAGRIAARVRCQEVASAPDWLPFSADTNDDRIGEIRLAAHDGRPAVALEMIEQARRSLSEGRTRRRIKLLMLEALAHKFAGDDARAHKPLRKALVQATPAKLIRTFLEEGDALTELLRYELNILRGNKLPKSETAAVCDFIEMLLSAAGVSAVSGLTAGGEANQPLEALTEREYGILRRLAEGESNKAIAKNLFVSENTVKFHLKNVYSKLGVASRVQAITAGREIGLI